MPAYTSDGDTQQPNFVGTGGGNFPKLPDILNELVAITPVKIEQVPSYDRKDMVDRLTADTVVLTGPHQGEYAGMWWSATPIVNGGARILRLSKNDVMLGRLRRFPQNQDKDKYPTPEAIEEALKNAKPGQTVNFAWALDKFSPEEAERASDFFSGKLKLTPDEGSADEDVFEDD